MNVSSNKRGTPSTPSLVTGVLLCGASFLLGRVSVHAPNAFGTDCSKCSNDRTPARSQATVGTDVHSLREAHTGPSDEDWEELMATTGLVEARPPLSPGFGGMNNYLTQPFQVRCLHATLSQLMPYMRECYRCAFLKWHALCAALSC